MLNKVLGNFFWKVTNLGIMLVETMFFALVLIGTMYLCSNKNILACVQVPDPGGHSLGLQSVSGKGQEAISQTG